MKKSEFINAIAEKADISKNDTKAYLVAVVDVIRDEIKAGGKIAIDGLGTFKMKETKDRVGVNPATGEKIQIKAKKSAKFTASKALKEYVL
jgi:DNA-binding protein HU-beta